MLIGGTVMMIVGVGVGVGVCGLGMIWIEYREKEDFRWDLISKK
jgi:hypothetical protein